MDIRSITLFENPQSPISGNVLNRAKQFNNRASEAFQEAGYAVQTLRLAAPPYPLVLPELDSAVLLDYARELETRALDAGFDYLSLGPALPSHPESYPMIPEVIAETEAVFLSGLLTDPSGGLSLPAVRACGEIIHQLSGLDPHGFSNLFFAALGSVPPGAPFFPAAYQGENQPCFALAIEGADLAVQAFQGTSSFFTARRNLIQSLEEQAQRLTAAAQKVAEDLGIPFSGIDYSLAPYPEDDRSLGAALEKLGGFRLGEHGSLTAAAFLADTIDRAAFPRTGFSGLMLPLLEDSRLAQRAQEGSLGIKDLLLYSAVCGTGLDTIPLPGNLEPGQISAVLFDLGALSCRLAKPLTARLMPIPGKKAGEPTTFDFPYFANSRILDLDSSSLAGAFTQDGYLDLRPRTYHQRNNPDPNPKDRT